MANMTGLVIRVFSHPQTEKSEAKTDIEKTLTAVPHVLDFESNVKLGLLGCLKNAWLTFFP